MLGIQPRAKADILEQFAYYLAETGTTETATRFLAAVQQAGEALCINPELGPRKSLPHPALRNLRSWRVKGFPSTRLYYLHTGEEITILRVLHGKRNLTKLLQEEAALH